MIESCGSWVAKGELNACYQRANTSWHHLQSWLHSWWSAKAIVGSCLAHLSTCSHQAKIRTWKAASPLCAPVIWAPQLLTCGVPIVSIRSCSVLLSCRSKHFKTMTVSNALDPSSWTCFRPSLRWNESSGGNLCAARRHSPRVVSNGSPNKSKLACGGCYCLPSWCGERNDQHLVGSARAEKVLVSANGVHKKTVLTCEIILTALLRFAAPSIQHEFSCSPYLHTDITALRFC